ncbi:uncharacterized protein LOC135398556 [Ornithodoros turicata]|uniref:uncharacterized protein LOC135398556 n=1 Tax=Ornithodoros turicata TaxID=34597 RepID=UPI00313A127D
MTSTDKQESGTPTALEQESQELMARHSMSSLLPPPKVLDTTQDIWNWWKLWRREFELFSVATGLKAQPKEVQAATFLVIIGEDGRKIYTTLHFDSEEERTDVAKLIEKFEAHRKPTVNLTYQEFLFGSRDQKEGERFDEWITELWVLAATYEFGSLETRMLRSRIILGTQDKALQQKLINENPPYEKVVEICRQRERSHPQLQEIQSDKKLKEEKSEVNAVQDNRSGRIPCSKCGYSMHRGGQCPAVGKVCKKCGKKNHFSSVCRTKNPGRPPRQRRRQHEKELRHLEYGDKADYFFQSLSSKRSDETEIWSAKVTIEGTNVSCRLDTGANCSVISSALLEKITDKKASKCSVPLSTFFGHSEKAEGRIQLHISFQGKDLSTEFFVVDRQVPTTLSGTVSEHLGLVSRMVHPTHVHKDNQLGLYEAARPYDDVFKGLGKLKGIVYHMRLKPNVKGVVKPARRIPVALKDKVKDTLDRMEADGVICKVTEPTERTSNMVVVAKKEKVRICLDPAYLNQALLREHFKMATLEDVVPRLSD